MNHARNLALKICFTVMIATYPVLAGPIDPARHAHPEQARAVHEAEHNVDGAWEVYHRAALGGTVASPAIQADIEQHLHEARTLVTQAHEAAERGEKRQVDRVVAAIKIHTSQAIKGSKEQKK
ncbi:MAG TPA: hypothetical protein VJR69_08240 [Nitrospira sp.]|nr:hypothetical protein [Nitrospira sp.]